MSLLHIAYCNCYQLQLFFCVNLSNNLSFQLRLFYNLPAHIPLISICLQCLFIAGRGEGVPSLQWGSCRRGCCTLYSFLLLVVHVIQYVYSHISSVSSILGCHGGMTASNQLQVPRSPAPPSIYNNATAALSSDSRLRIGSCSTARTSVTLPELSPYLRFN